MADGSVAVDGVLVYVDRVAARLVVPRVYPLSTNLLVTSALVRSFHRRAALYNVDQRHGKVREPLGKERG